MWKCSGNENRKARWPQKESIGGSAQAADPPMRILCCRFLGWEWQTRPSFTPVFSRYSGGDQAVSRGWERVPFLLQRRIFTIMKTVRPSIRIRTSRVSRKNMSPSSRLFRPKS